MGWKKRGKLELNQVISNVLQFLDEVGKRLSK